MILQAPECFRFGCVIIEWAICVCFNGKFETERNFFFNDKATKLTHTHNEGIALIVGALLCVAETGKTHTARAREDMGNGNKSPTTKGRKTVGYHRLSVYLY